LAGKAGKHGVAAVVGAVEPLPEDLVRDVVDDQLLELARGVQRRFHAQLIGDVVRHHEAGQAAGDGHRVGGDLHVDQAAVAAPMDPAAGPFRALGRGDGQVAFKALDLLGGTDVLDRHLQEFRLRIAVVGDGGGVHHQEAQRFQIVHPHRLRMLFEQMLEAQLGFEYIVVVHRMGQAQQGSLLAASRGAPFQCLRHHVADAVDVQQLQLAAPVAARMHGGQRLAAQHRQRPCRIQRGDGIAGLDRPQGRDGITVDGQQLLVFVHDKGEIGAVGEKVFEVRVAIQRFQLAPGVATMRGIFLLIHIHSAGRKRCGSILTEQTPPWPHD
jgi:hypothetical protein